MFEGIEEPDLYYRETWVDRLIAAEAAENEAQALRNKFGDVAPAIAAGAFLGSHQLKEQQKHVA